ncbi:DUF3120 domain-containing protein [Euhalothece natronophila]|uniref:DUF3120 domain-containing protein n=1 Tax=Euhalothece natronophila TaxID=577489 RepID=UPI001FE5FCAC|nr:DUF3120 domain-containing protein [Euhalothece natronophila]
MYLRAFVLKQKSWLIFATSGFLVSIPVFAQAPMVRELPWLSLILTFGWVALGIILFQRPRSNIWGDLILGFSWSWLAGSIYWGWFRWEPVIHLPIEAIGLPFAFFALARGLGPVGNLFYLGSLLGTALTDVYFYLTGLMPHWRELMRVDPALYKPIFQDALLNMQTPWGMSCAVLIICVLLVLGIWSLKQNTLPWFAFSGAILSTLLVDGLFWIAAAMA